jgi:hypothetical protein
VRLAWGRGRSQSAASGGEKKAGSFRQGRNLRSSRPNAAGNDSRESEGFLSGALPSSGQAEARCRRAGMWGPFEAQDFHLPKRAKPSAAEADFFVVAFSARLKACPDEERRSEDRHYVTARKKAGPSAALGDSREKTEGRSPAARAPRAHPCVNQNRKDGAPATLYAITFSAGPPGPVPSMGEQCS